MRYFVTGIGTDVGKTVVSAVLVEALKADYWKPVQCGYPRDSEVVESLITGGTGTFHKEHYLLDEPASPHQAAHNQGIELHLRDIAPPDTSNHLVIEGAGGLMVPLNNRELIIDMAEMFSDKLILVASLYLGSINHSLLSIEVLKKRGMEIAGIIFNGMPNPHSESIILSYSESRSLLHLPPDSDINPQNIQKWAQALRKNMEVIF